MKKFLAMTFAVCLLLAMTGCGSEPADAALKSYSDVTACFVGDSITKGHTLADGEMTYWQNVDVSLNFKEVVGLGINGSAYSVTSDNGMENGPMTTRYQTVPQTDLIFIALGVNDFFENTAIGSIEDTEDVSFYGAINFTLDKLAEQCPESKIILMTPIRCYTNPTNKAGHKLTEYVDAIKTVAAQRQLLVVDMQTLTYDTLPEGMFNDSAHPNKFGQQIMGEALQKWLEENIESVLG